MQTQSGDENSVRPSVSPSVCVLNAWIVTKQKKDLSIFLYHTKEYLASFSEKRMVSGGDPFYLKFWINRPPLERNRGF